jgi:hypothetical protein
MNQALPLWTRQGLAVGALATLLACLWGFVIWPVINLAVSRQADILALSSQLQELKAVATRRPIFVQREQHIAGQLQRLGLFWSGPNEGAIAASMQDLVRKSAQESGGIVTSTSTLPADATTAAGMLAIRARVEGSLATLQHVLGALEGATPRLFIDNLAISTVSPSTHDHPQQLSFEFSAAGYLASSVKHAN